MFKFSKIQNIFLAVILTWQAQSFVPADYHGKILPTTGANIKTGLEVVNENKIKDLSKINIRWYLDGKLLTQGLGLKEINFNATYAATYSHFVRAVVLDTEEISGSVDIPIVSPKIIIKTPTPATNSIFLGKTLLQAIPYFFNVTDLKNLIFNWTVNDKTIKGANFLELELTPPVPQDNNLRIRVTAQNLNNDLEFGFKEINLNVQQ
jgi:hypothetical protein